MGYKWDVSVNVDELRNYSGYPLMMCPTKLIKELLFNEYYYEFDFLESR